VIPTTLWLRRELRPLVERLLNPTRLQRQGLFQSTFYQSFVLPHLDGKADFTSQVWAALMFQMWHLIYIEQKETVAPSYDWQAMAGFD
jgi:asparagine synthase (glutamine-hydrolysing)